MGTVESGDLRALSHALNARGASHLYVGKTAAIIHGFADTTQNVDGYVEPTPENLARVVRALQDLRFPLSEGEADRLRSGCALARLRHRAMDLG